MENVGTIILPRVGITFQPRWIFTLRRCQKLQTVNEAVNQKHTLVQRHVFLGARNRHPSGRFHGLIQLKSLPCNISLCYFLLLSLPFSSSSERQTDTERARDKHREKDLQRQRETGKDFASVRTYF